MLNNIFCVSVIYLIELVVFADCHTAASTSTSPLDEYRRRVNVNQIQSDEHQLRVLNELQRLYSDIDKCERTTTTGLLQVCSISCFLMRCEFQYFAKLNLYHKAKSKSPRGVYIYGSVGVGKTMLMDLFYDCCTSPRKQRMHYNEFMGDIHKSERNWFYSNYYFRYSRFETFEREGCRYNDNDCRWCYCTHSCLVFGRISGVYFMFRICQRWFR